MDCDVKALKVYCPNKKDGCGWTGEIARVDDHVKVCKISCSKCRQIVYFSTMKSHLDTECPCYCSYCDITAEREVISSEHKEKCCKFCPNNIGVDNGPHDKFDIKTNKINELQNNIFEKINETFNPSILVELQKDISTIKEEVVVSIQIAKECSEKVDKQLNEIDKQNDTTLMDRLCNTRLYLTIAVLIIAVLMALLLQSPHGMREDWIVEHLNSLQANVSMITTELHNISQPVSKLPGIQNNTVLFTELIEEVIRGMNAITLWQPIITELNQSVSKLQTMQQNGSLWNKQIEEIIRGMDGKLNETRELQVKLSKYFATELHNISLSVSKHLSKINTLNVIQHEVNETKEQLYSLQVKLEGGIMQNITELHQQIILLHEILNKTVAHQQYHYSNSVWFIKLWLSSDDVSNQVAPAIVKMSSFTKYLRDKEEWYSDSFFAFEGGYQLCIRVDAAGHYNRSSTNHVGVFLYLMKGPHDDKLEQSGHWPLRGTFTIELLNQLNDSDHYSRMIQQYHHICSDCTERVVDGEIGQLAKRGWGYPNYISSNDVVYPLLIRGVLFFRISYEHTLIKNDLVAPVTLAISKFTEKIKYSEEWYSNPFLAFEGGYQLCLKVYAAGVGDGKGTHVSVYLFLMKGPHDDKLEQSGHWPLRGTFTIELLNQFTDHAHYTPIEMSHTIETVNRVEDKNESYGIKAIFRFISHDTLFQRSSYYLKNDVLIFKVSYLESKS